VTLDEASRDTRIRREFLVALEGEDFDRLLGDVYVRGSIRSYATYLGLASDQMVQAYARFAAAPAEAPVPAGPPAPENPIDAPRRRDSHRLFVMIAATLLILNVDTQVGEHVDDLGETLLEIWPSYIGYVVSFVP